MGLPCISFAPDGLQDGLLHPDRVVYFTCDRIIEPLNPTACLHLSIFLCLAIYRKPDEQWTITHQRLFGKTKTGVMVPFFQYIFRDVVVPFFQFILRDVVRRYLLSFHIWAKIVGKSKVTRHEVWLEGTRVMFGFIASSRKPIPYEHVTLRSVQREAHWTISAMGNTEREDWKGYSPFSCPPTYRPISRWDFDPAIYV